MSGAMEEQLSVTDFYLGSETDPLAPPPEFAEWLRATEPAWSLYERSLCAAPTARTLLEVRGQPHPVINLTSYNYLGLSCHPEVIAAARETLESWGTGACGSAILSGMTVLHRELERQIAGLLGRETTLLFSSGFGGALGLTSGFLRRGDVAVVDERVHISLMDGVRLSGAQTATFTHNDPAALDQVLARYPNRRRVVVVEGLYSMDGDLPDLPALLEVAEAHGVGLVIDEAHSFLAFGETGGGITEQAGVQDRVRLFYGTFSKALGGIGGFVSGPADALGYMRLFSHPYAFSCALPPLTVAGLLAGLRVATRDRTLRARLLENGEYFRRGLQSIGIDTGLSTTHVVPIVLGRRRDLLYTAGHQLVERGLFLAPVDYPAVPEDQVRFRASVTAMHTREDLDEALQIIEDVIARPLRRGVG